MNIVEELSDKRVLIWGYGREGKSTEQFLKQFCKVKSLSVYEGNRDGIAEEEYDIIVKSPGIVMMEDHPKYTSQTELFLAQFRNQVIGITGTKGKSTTSTLLYTTLRECSGRDVVLLGNIGQPCLDYFGAITDDTIIVFEMSCHQLAHTKISPRIALFLNLYEEHLDYYKTYEKYFLAKSNIARYQKSRDVFLVGENVPEIPTEAKTIRIPMIPEKKYELGTPGEHNQYNAEFVFRVATELFSLEKAKVLESMKHFQGLPHRLEYVGSVNGIRFYDDSISTIPEATISAVHSIDKVQTVLVGGMDRKINYDRLTDFIQKRQDVYFICTYDSGKRIYESVKECKNCFYREDLEKAVELAKEITQEGYACILSPAAASYGYFKNFEERGDAFRGYIETALQ